MLFLILLNGIDAFTNEAHIPTIMIAQRTINSLIGTRSNGPVNPLFIEKLFRERALPIMIRASLDQRPVFSNERSGEEYKSHIYRNRRNIGDRVIESSDSTDSIPLRRVTFGPIPERSRTPSVEDESKKPAIPDKKAHPYLRAFFVLLAIVVAAAVGYHCGKVHESRNYVRVPSTN